MNIMVFNVPAETAGALSILNDFYNEVRAHKNKSINWIFVVSKPKLEEIENIKVLRFPWVKKSWWHRLYFDNIVAPKLIEKYKIDKVLSFQNTIIPHIKVDQILYMHNSLPFVDYKFNFKENRLLWTYQNLISKIIIRSIKKANKVIVQAEWIKKICVEKHGIDTDKVDVLPPQVNIDTSKFFKPNKESLMIFFYPASGFIYKNHIIIIEACKKIKERNLKGFKIIFTLKGDEDDHIKNLYKEVKENQLPIEFVGALTRDQVFEMYTKAVLLFPSYIESSPLPLTEGMIYKSMILASDCPFSHEVLEGYKNAYFFDPYNVNALFSLMSAVITKDITYNTVKNTTATQNIAKESIFNKIMYTFNCDREE